MSTLPMYRTDVAAPQWRDLFAPGGYEFFEINLPAAELLMRIGIGNPYSQEYRQLDQQYRRSPTQNRPALPAAYPFALLEYREKRTLLDEKGAELKLGGGSSIRFGPAQILWNKSIVRCSWTNGTIDLRLEANADSTIHIQTDPRGEIRESSSLRATSPILAAGPGEIAHVLASCLQVTS